MTGPYKIKKLGTYQTKMDVACLKEKKQHLKIGFKSVKMLQSSEVKGKALAYI